MERHEERILLLGYSLTNVARRLSMIPAGVAYEINRGQRVVGDGDYQLVEKVSYNLKCPSIPRISPHMGGSIRAVNNKIITFVIGAKETL